MQTDLELFEEFLREHKALTKFKEALWEKEKFNRAVSPKYLNPELNRKPIPKKDVWDKYKEAAFSKEVAPGSLKYCISGHIRWVKDFMFWKNLSDEWKVFYSLMLYWGKV